MCSVASALGGHRLRMAGYVAGAGPRGGAIAAGGCPEGANIGYSQERTIPYLKVENGVLLEKLGGRVRLTDRERRRLGKLGHELGRKALREVACIASPDTILRWYRE